MTVSAAGIISGLNEVWRVINEHGGVPDVARLFGLMEVVVWGWIDDHEVPMPYDRYLADGKPVARTMRDMQLSSVGCEDPETGACWPANWRD